MTKVEYLVNMYYCHIRCTPEEERCKDCQILEVHKQFYGDEKYK